MSPLNKLFFLALCLPDIPPAKPLRSMHVQRHEGLVSSHAPDVHRINTGIHWQC